MSTVLEVIKTITRVIVHPGVFHADDVFVVAWLRHMHYRGDVERRVPTESELNDPTVLVADIGGRYEPKLLNFDHHQRGGAGERWDSEVPYAAFGLVFQHFSGDTPECARFHDRLVIPIDAADTGFAAIDPSSVEGVKVAYRFAPCSLSATIASFNPVGETTDKLRDGAFSMAVGVAQQIIENFESEACYFVESRKAVLEAEQIVPHVLHLPEYAPWGEHVFDRDDSDDLLYVTFPSARGGYIIQQMPAAPGSFEGRKPLPEEWAGLRDDDFRKVTGVSDATFCHPGRFCGGAESLDGTIALAAMAVQA